jgi:putative membrane protein
MLAIGSYLFAQTQAAPWVWDSFAWNILSTTAFGLIGIVLAMIGFKLFDYLTPGKLEEEIIQKQNLAAAILGGAIVLGICLIVSRAVS